MIHRLKIVSPYYEAVLGEEKNFEIRKNDRNFQVNDFIALHHYDPVKQEYIKEDPVIETIITYILDDPEYVKDGTVVMSIEHL